MRVALCLSGDLRTFLSNYDSLNNNLLILYNVDIFISTWNEEQVTQIYKLYNPKVAIIQDKLELPRTALITSKNIESARKINNVLGMFCKIKQANDLKSNYESLNGFKYDVVIRLRPDINLKEKLIITQNDQVNRHPPKGGGF